MNNIAQKCKKYYPNMKPKDRSIIKQYFADMTEASSRDELYSVFRNLAKIIQSRFLGEDIKPLLDRGYVGSECDSVESTDALVVEDAGRYRDKCAVGQKFVTVAEDVSNKIGNEGTLKNPFYSPSFMEHIQTTCMPFTPLWCGIHGGTETNGLVEGWHKIVKRDILRGKQISPASFLLKMYKQTKGRTKESEKDYKIVKKKVISNGSEYVERWSNRKPKLKQSYTSKAQEKAKVRQGRLSEKDDSHKTQSRHVSNILKLAKFRPRSISTSPRKKESYKKVKSRDDHDQNVNEDKLFSLETYKSQEIYSPSQMMWLSRFGLKLKDKENILQCSSWLSSDAIEGFARLVRDCHPQFKFDSPLTCFHPPPLRDASEKFIQVLNTTYSQCKVTVKKTGYKGASDGGTHWIVVTNALSRDRSEGVAHVQHICSLNGAPSTDVKEYLQKIYAGIKTIRKLRIECVTVQHQMDTSSCGPFSLAFVTSVVNGQDPSLITYVKEKMRTHIIFCLEQNVVMDFPSSKRKENFTDEEGKLVGLYGERIFKIEEIQLDS